MDDRYIIKHRDQTKAIKRHLPKRITGCMAAISLYQTPAEFIIVVKFKTFRIKFKKVQKSSRKNKVHKSS